MLSSSTKNESKLAIPWHRRQCLPSGLRRDKTNILALILTLTLASVPALSQGQRVTHRGVDARTKYGQTALMHAAAHGDLERVRRLLHRGADIHAVDSNGATVLTLAVQPGNIRTVRFLLDHGMGVNEADPYGTPLIHAVQIKDVPIVTFLLARGADLQAQDRELNNTAIGWSLQEGDARIARILIAHGASLPIWEVNQNFWLIFCEVDNYYDFAKLLLDRGANVNVHYQNGSNALIDAAKFGRAAMVRLFISRGADLNARINTGMTALQWARVRGHFDIAVLLAKAGEKN